MGMGNSADYSWLASSFPSSYRYPEARELVARWTVGLGKARKPGGIWLPLPRKTNPARVPCFPQPCNGGKWGRSVSIPLVHVATGTLRQAVNGIAHETCMTPA